MPETFRGDRLRAVAGGLSEKFEASGTTPELKAAVQQVIERVEVGLPAGVGRKRPGLAGRAVRIVLRPPDAWGML